VIQSWMLVTATVTVTAGVLLVPEYIVN